MGIIDITGPRISAPLPSAALPYLNCGDLAKLIKLKGLGKFDREKFTKSLIQFAIGEMISGPFSRMINNDSLLPGELAGLGAMLGVGSLLTDPKNATRNMSGLWSRISSNCVQNLNKISTGMAPDLNSFSASIASLPRPIVSEGNIAIGVAAAQKILSGTSPDSAEMEARLKTLCFPYGVNSPAIFAALDLANSLLNQTGTMNIALDTGSMIFDAASQTLVTSKRLAPFGVNEQLSAAGTAGVAFDLQQLEGLKNFPPEFFYPGGPDSLKAASILSKACTAVEKFYSINGFGTANWANITKNFSDTVTTGSIAGIAKSSTNFKNFSSDDIILDVQSQVNTFLARAMRDGGSDNLATAFNNDFRRALSAGEAGLAVVATLYAAEQQMTQTFINALAIMEQFGSAEAIQSILGGNLDLLFGLASGQITSPYLAALRALRDCMKEGLGSEDAIAIIEAQIKKAESLENTKWAMNIGKFDLLGYFAKAQKVLDSFTEISDNFISGSTIRFGGTTVQVG